MKKLFTLLMCAMLASSALAGCGDQNTTSTGGSSTTSGGDSTSSSTAVTDSNLSAPGELPIVKEKVTLKISVVDLPYVGKYEDHTFTKWMEEQTNVHIEWNEIQQDALGEKINLSLVSGDLPDVYLGCAITSAQQIQYGSRGTFLALNDLIDTQGYEIKKIEEDLPVMLDTITAPDGNIYALPMINDCFHCKYGARSWINQEWLDAVGKEVPTTTAEFEEVLQAFKDQDPNGNGQADELPMLGAAKWKNDIYPILMQPFTFSQATYLDDNGTVVFGPTMDAYKTGLSWIHGLIEKGLLDSSSLTQSNDQYKAIMSNPDAVRVGVPVDFNLHESFSSDISRVKQYVALPPLEGPDGVRGMATNANTQAITGGYYVITNKCENPEVAFRWADYWYSEDATMMSWNGQEGVGWEKPESGNDLNGNPAKWKVLQNPANDYSDPEQLITMTNIFGNNNAELRESLLVDESGDGIYALDPFLHNAAKVLEPYGKPDNTLPPLFFTEEEASEYATLNTQINDYVTEQFALFVLGERDVENDWDSYVKEYEALKLDRYLELVQTAYDRQYK